MSDSFLVCDVSAAAAAENSPSFAVTIDPRQLRLLFVNGVCELTDVDRNYDDTGVEYPRFV